MKYLFLALLLIFVSCGNIRTNYFTDEQKISVEVDRALYNSQIKLDSIVYVDLRKAIDNSEPFNVNLLIDSIKVIILEDSTVDALLGNIEKIIITDNFIYIMDYIDGNGVVIFDKNGHLVRRIPKGNGPGEISRVYDITYDKYTRRLLLSVPRGLCMYEENGEYIDMSIIPLQFVDIECTQNGYICKQGVSTYNEHLQQHQGNSILFVDRNYKLKWSALPHFNYTSWSMGYMLLNTTTECVYPDPFNDTIYGIDETSVYTKYVMNLGSDKFPNIYANNKELLSIENFNKIFRASNYAFMANYLETRTHQFFRISHSQEGYSCIFRDKLSGHIVGGQAFLVNQYELPVLYDPSFVSEDWFVLPYGISGGWHFSSPLISDDDNEQMSKLSDEANPVLFMYKLKHF